MQVVARVVEVPAAVLGDPPGADGGAEERKGPGVLILADDAVELAGLLEVAHALGGAKDGQVGSQDWEEVD